MTIIERLELIRAGYKRAEIDAMIKADEDAAKAPPKEEPKQEEPKEEQKKPQEQPKKDEPNDVDALKAELAELRKQMQLQNIQKIGLDTPPQKSVEEVLAEAVFGNPEKK